MVPADSRDRWPPELLGDDRVRHFWDAGKVVGTWYAENAARQSNRKVEWDAWFLYAPRSSWGENGPSLEVGHGRTIVQTREQLKAALLEQLGGKP